MSHVQNVTLHNREPPGTTRRCLPLAELLPDRCGDSQKPFCSSGSTGGDLGRGAASLLLRSRPLRADAHGLLVGAWLLSAHLHQYLFSTYSGDVSLMSAASELTA